MNIEQSAEKVKQLEGLKGLSLVDASSGMSLFNETLDNNYNMELVSAAMTSVLKQVHRATQQSHFHGNVEDMLLEFPTVYVTATPLPKKPGIFGLLMLDRERCNLAMVRLTLREVMKQLDF